MVCASRKKEAPSRSGSPIETWITWSSAFLIQVFSGASPSWVACRRIVSEVARLTWATNGVAGTEKAYQITRASHSS